MQTSRHPAGCSQPRSGCVIQPKVAVLSYLGDAVMISRTLKGFRPHSQMCLIPAAATPLGLAPIAMSPKVAEYSNLGLRVAIPVGIACLECPNSSATRCVRLGNEQFPLSLFNPQSEIRDSQSA
jgi:hypothetical protein